MRFAFLLPRTMLRSVKQLALDEDRTSSDLVRSWLELGLSGEFDLDPVMLPPRSGRLAQFPITLSPATREALRRQSEAEDASASQLARRWVAIGLARAQQTPSPG